MELTNGKFSSLYLTEQINVFREAEGNKNPLLHKDLIKKIEKEFEEEIGERKFSPTSYKDKSNRESKCYELNYEQSVQILVSESRIVRKAVLAKLKSFEARVEDGLLLNHEEILELTPLIEASFFLEFREKARDSHLSLYLPPNPKSKDYANAHLKRKLICGIDKEEIAKRLNDVNQRSKTLQKDLIRLDKYELIRIAVIDCMLFFGKSKEYAINIGGLCKEMAIKNERANFDRANTMYLVPREYMNTIALLK